MADKTPKYGSSALNSDDLVLWKEIATNIYALAQAASLMVGTELVSSSNPLPVYSTIGPTTAITPTHTAVNVGVASTIIIAANVNRKYLLIVNNSNFFVYINLGGVAVVNRGIPITPNGGNYEMAAAHDNLYTGQITAIHGDAGTKLLLMTEGV